MQVSSRLEEELLTPKIHDVRAKNLDNLELLILKNLTHKKTTCLKLIQMILKILTDMMMILQRLIVGKWLINLVLSLTEASLQQAIAVLLYKISLLVKP